MSEVSARTIRRCQAGDLEALGEIYRASGAAVFRVALRLLGSHADAEDATQQIFLRLHRQVSKFDGRSAFSTWLYRVSTNHCLNLLAGRRKLASLSDLGEGAFDSRPPETPEPPADPDEPTSVSALLGELHPDDRAIIILKDVQGLSYRQLAEVLGVPMGTVMSRLHRARRRFLAVARLREPVPTETAKSVRPLTCPTPGGTTEP